MGGPWGRLGVGAELFVGGEVVDHVLVKLVNGAALNAMVGDDLDVLMWMLLVTVNTGRWMINKGRDGGLVLLVFR